MHPLGSTHSQLTDQEEQFNRERQRNGGANRR